MCVLIEAYISGRPWPTAISSTATNFFLKLDLVFTGYPWTKSKSVLQGVPNVHEGCRLYTKKVVSVMPYPEL